MGHLGIVAAGWALGAGVVAGGAILLRGAARPLLRSAIAGCVALTNQARRLVMQVAEEEVEDIYE